MSCDPCKDTKTTLHTEVPRKGDPGDSTGYLALNPLKDEEFRMRQRWPFAFLLATVAADGVPRDKVYYRMATGHVALGGQPFAPWPGSVKVPADTTVELQMTTPHEGAVYSLQITKAD